MTIYAVDGVHMNNTAIRLLNALGGNDFILFSQQINTIMNEEGAFKNFSTALKLIQQYIFEIIELHHRLFLIKEIPVNVNFKITSFYEVITPSRGLIMRIEPPDNLYSSDPISLRITNMLVARTNRVNMTNNDRIRCCPHIRASGYTYSYINVIVENI